MTRREFDARLLAERRDFLLLCQAARVWVRVETISPRLAPAFAAELMMAWDTGQATRRIEQDPAGAAALNAVVAERASDRSDRSRLAATMPSGELPRFYVICSLVLEIERDLQG